MSHRSHAGTCAVPHRRSNWSNHHTAYRCTQCRTEHLSASSVAPVSSPKDGDKWRRSIMPHRSHAGKLVSIMPHQAPSLGFVVAGTSGRQCAHRTRCRHPHTQLQSTTAMIPWRTTISEKFFRLLHSWMRYWYVLGWRARSPKLLTGFGKDADADNAQALPSLVRSS
jgi:hypothetical protein